jgi:hypothetical protein
MAKQAGWVCAAVVSLAACGGGGGGGVTATPSGPLLQVAGAYDIRKSVIEETCGLSRPGDVFTNPGTVAHAPGATDFVLNDHGTRDLPGTVRRDGGFDLRPQSSVVMGTIPATDTFENGRFTATGFALRVTTVLQRSPVADAPAGPCRVVTLWDGTKQGGPNVIP